MAQISTEGNNRIVGWKPWMYIKEEFRNTKQEFIDGHGESKSGNVALELDGYVENWFKENGVNYQKTSTGINMLHNIITYIGLVFKPVSKNETAVFLEKDINNPLSKQEIRELIRMAKQGKLCSKPNYLKDRVRYSLENNNIDSSFMKKQNEAKIEEESDLEEKQV